MSESHNIAFKVAERLRKRAAHHRKVDAMRHGRWALATAVKQMRDLGLSESDIASLLRSVVDETVALERALDE
jgi:hypothetical protein